VVNGEEISDAGVYSQLVQKPNPRIPFIGVPLGLHIFNLADPAPQESFDDWLQKTPKREQRLVNFLSRKQVIALDSSYVNFNEWLQRTGDAPVIVAEAKAQKSADRLRQYYFSFGWFNNKVGYTITPNEDKEKRASVTYSVSLAKPYILDSITTNISSPVVDSLFQLSKRSSFLKSGQQYTAADFNNERDRLTIQFRNAGLYHFEQDYITFDADTVNTNHRVNVRYDIPDREVTVNDSTYREPFKIHRVNEVRIVTDYSLANRNETFSDSTTFKGYKLYSYDAMKFDPKAITDAISITPNTIFKDVDRSLTYNQISDLRIFKYPSISYAEDPSDTTGTGLIATVLLTPQKKFTLGADFDAYTSTIQQFGIGFSSSFLIRNVFRGAEILEISGSGSVGSSKDAADDESFFNISEIGGELKLSFPRILFPLNTDKIIPKYMSPSTSISLGANAQNNIGLDRQTINAIFNYRWKPSKTKTYQIDLLNVQYVRNLNTGNYFNVYQNSFEQLNNIARDTESANPGSVDPDNYTVNSNDIIRLTVPDGANSFINSVLNGEIPAIPKGSEAFEIVDNIDERKERLTEDNLIFATNFTWLRDSRENIFDLNFSRLRLKVESAGNLLTGIANLAGLEQNANGSYKTLGVVYSQYARFEADYIKHWNLGDDDVLAIRAFGGIAIPYGNSNSIPFTRSYFAGGANDNRGWRAYDLGPGSSGGTSEFNEANLKLAANAEYRFTVLGAFKGAFFADAGNIWNVFDNIDDPASRFEGIADLREIALATGVGLRYDFGFAVLRFDVGFKTYNPALSEGNRWFTDYNFRNAVYNIGINYPF
jgi:outer membrane protein assembly factor BamA